MRQRLSFALMVGVLALTLRPAWAAVTASNKLPDGARFAVDGDTLRVQFWSDDIVRVTYSAATEIPTNTSLAVVGTPTKARFTRQEKGHSFTLVSPHMKVRIDKQSGAVSFSDLAGHVLLQESAQGRSIAPATQRSISGNSCALSFDLSIDEGIYGLGQHQQGTWNYAAGNGSNVRLAQANTEVGIPVITSSKGYMLLWDDPAVTTISSHLAGDTNASQKVLRWSSEWGNAIDYYFCYGGGSIDDALKAYRHLTGDAPLMPKWELGFWQCKERYASQDELLGVAKRLRELKVPVDGIIQDWQYWPPGTNTWGSHLFDPSRYPDPVGMFKELHDMNYHTLISVWAKFDLGSDNSKELNAVGGMFPQVTRYVSPPGQGQWYDPFAVLGRQTYWKQMRDQLFAKGVDGWWLDAPEPEINGMGFRSYTTPMGPGHEVYNAYPLYTCA
jgi:alpha-D-xyloside xylohydrolase